MEPIIAFVLVLSLLFIIPKMLLRYGIPAQLTEVLLGMILGPYLLNYFQRDALFSVLGTIGIITLFFMAGFDVDIESVKKKRKTIFEHGFLQLVLITIAALSITLFTSYSLTTAALIALALVSPSAGFILGSLKTLRISAGIKEWVEVKVISAEILSLFLLLIILKIASPFTLMTILGSIVLLFWVLPYFLKIFYTSLLAKIDGVDMFFLFLISSCIAVSTHLIGIHYIIGAFVVGLIVTKFPIHTRHSVENPHEKIGTTFSSFAAIFVPFYFFSAGLAITKEMLTWHGLLFASLLFVLIFFIRIVISFIHRRLTLRENIMSSVQVAFLTTPTLLFTFVMEELLRESNLISMSTAGILVIYALLSTLIPLSISILEKKLKRVHKVEVKMYKRL